MIMEKLDGDLTNYIIKNSYINSYGNLDDYDFYYNRLPKTMVKFINQQEDTSENIQKYNQIIKNVKKYVFEICYSLNIQLLLQHHELIKRGWEYSDLKLDNIGLKKSKSNEKIELLFIDLESGLINLEDYTNNNSFIKKINFQEYLNLHCFNTNLGDYGTLGQYSLRYIFDIDFVNFYPKFVDKELIVEKLKSKNLVKRDEDLNFNWIKFIHSGSNNFFVIQFIMGFYRLVFFDDNSLHMSNTNYNHYFDSFKIDELFYSIDTLYKKLDEFYP
jgi:hypothetical protein